MEAEINLSRSEQMYNGSKLTEQQGVILTGFTGVTCVPFHLFHKDVELRLGRPVWTHEFGSEEFSEKLKKLYTEDFLGMMPDWEKQYGN